MSTEPPKGNGRNGLLASLAASGDRWIQLAILALITLSGSSNWFATNQNGSTLNRAIEEIHAMHKDWDASVQRNKETNNDLKLALKHQEEHAAETLVILQRIEQKLQP